MRRIVAFLIFAVSAAAAAPNELSVKGTRFLLDGQPFPYTGLSFFNAIYNPAFNASSEARVGWLEKFKAHGINVLRIWCQWDNARGFVDAGPDCTLYAKDGALKAHHLETLKAILTDCAGQGMAVELALFSQESFKENIKLGQPGDERAVAALTSELRPFRNLTFQIWNEHTDARVLPLVKLIKAIDPRRLVTNSPGYAGVLGSDEENAALDYLTPHTTRHGKEPHWEKAPRELAGLLKRFRKPVVDDEPARNGTKNFGGPKEDTSPYDQILHITAVWRVGAYPTYHHDMFQTVTAPHPVLPAAYPTPASAPTIASFSTS